MDKTDKGEKPWVVRDVPARTRKLVKLYAVDHGITMGEAIEQLVDTALQPKPRSVNKGVGKRLYKKPVKGTVLRERAIRYGREVDDEES